METPLRKVDSLKGFELGVHDGKIGKCSDFLFDDEVWGIRYLVAYTLKWLPVRKVLISPINIGNVDGVSQTINIDLSKVQVKNSPPLDSDAPVSRQYEIIFNNYYGLSDYWDGAGIWDKEIYPRTLRSREKLLGVEDVYGKKSNLRSTKEVTGYRIHARDGDIGHIEDFLIEEDAWLIRYLVIDTSNWIPGSKRVIVDPNWVDAIDWAGHSISLRMTKEQVESSPEYNPLNQVSREYEKSIFDHYNFPYYW